MPRAPKPFLTAIWLQSQGWFLAAIIDVTKKAAAELAFAQIEDPGATTSKSLARYTAQVYRDPSTGTLWAKPAAWTGARTLESGLFPKAFRDHVLEKEIPRLDRTSVRMPTKVRNLDYVHDIASVCP